MLASQVRKTDVINIFFVSGFFSVNLKSFQIVFLPQGSSHLVHDSSQNMRGFCKYMLQ